MKHSWRVGILLCVLALSIFVFWQYSDRVYIFSLTKFNAKTPSLSALLEKTSPLRQMLRRREFSALDARLAAQEQAALLDNFSERAFLRSLEELGIATESDMSLLEEWSAQGSHYAKLALARAYRIRAFHIRGQDYANKVDPDNLRRFAEHTKKSYGYAEEAAKLHTGCGVAYGQMIEALVGIGRREEMDSLFARSQDLAPQWFSPITSYFYALLPNWYGLPGEREAFLNRFEHNNPNHRAITRLHAIEYTHKATRAINDRNYGEGMILADLALKHDPNNAYSWKQKGMAYEGVQRSSDALAAYDKSIELYPFDETAYRSRGLLRLTMNNAEGQNDLAVAAILGDTWSLKKTMFNWLRGSPPGIEKDWSRIPELCDMARQYGIPDGTFCIATAYYFGYGVTQDSKKGFMLMKEAADSGVADAMSDVGKIYWKGDAGAGLAPNKENALRYWMRAAAIGNDRALVELNQVKNDPELLTLMKKLSEQDASRMWPIIDTDHEPAGIVKN